MVSNIESKVFDTAHNHLLDPSKISDGFGVSDGSDESDESDKGGEGGRGYEIWFNAESRIRIRVWK